MDHCYLVIVVMGKPRPEHAQIKQVLDVASNGNFKVIHTGTKEICFVMKTKLNAHQISFDRIIFNDDKFLIIELGEDWNQFGLGVAAGWLRANLENQSSRPA